MNGAEHNTTAIQLQNSANALVEQMKPMPVSQIFSNMVDLYVDHGLVLFKAMAVVHIPIIVGLAVAIPIGLLFPEIGVLSGWLLGAFTAPFHIIAMISAPVVAAKIVSDSFLEKDVDLWETLLFAWDRKWAVLSSYIATTICWLGITILTGCVAMMGGGILWALGVAAGLEAVAAILLMLMSVPFVLFTIFSGVFFALAPVVSVLENKHWFESPIRSARLIAPNASSVLRFAGVMMVIGLLTTIGGLAISIPSSIIAGIISGILGVSFIGPALQSIVSLIAPIFIYPASFIISGYLYYDHRIRYEQYSLDELRKAKDLE